MSDRAALNTLTDAVLADEGIRYRVSAADRRGAERAADLMNDVVAAALAATGVNADGRVDEADVAALSAHIRADPDLYADFLEGHGDDEGNEETGFHLVQGDGGTSLFQGRRFVDTVADAIYHIGFRIVDGRFENEDGDENETVADVAGWLNWFLNGESVVYGSNAGEDLHSGTYSVSLAAAESELFLAGGGNDTVRGEHGDDTVLGGTGNDRVSGQEGDDMLRGDAGEDTLSGGEGDDRLVGGTEADLLIGGEGRDRMAGGAGNDSLWGESGRDRMNGGGGDDRMGGGTGNDRMGGGGGSDTLAGEGGDDDMRGGAGADTLWAGEGDDRLSGGGGDDRLAGEAGADALTGGGGNDSMSGDAGDDLLEGGKGADTLFGGEGTDRIVGGAGADVLLDWEDAESPDVFVFATGDSGLGAEADIVRGFDSGRDRLDLSGYGDLDFAGARLSGDGPSVAFNDRVLSIDVDGDGAADEAIVLEWLSTLVRSDLILGDGDL